MAFPRYMPIRRTANVQTRQFEIVALIHDREYTVFAGTLHDVLAFQEELFNSNIGHTEI